MTLSSPLSQPLVTAPHDPADGVAGSLVNREVTVSPLSHVPGRRVVRYLGCINVSFVRESLSVRQVGGLSSFTHTLIAEAGAVVRGHVAAMGGNALLNYRLVPRESTGKVARNQAYHLVTVSGDVVAIV